MRITFKNEYELNPTEIEQIKQLLKQWTSGKLDMMGYLY